MRVIINDKRYGALKTLGERKQVFNEVSSLFLFFLVCFYDACFTILCMLPTIFFFFFKETGII